MLAVIKLEHHTETQHCGTECRQNSAFCMFVDVELLKPLCLAEFTGKRHKPGVQDKHGDVYKSGRRIKLPRENAGHKCTTGARENLI